MNPPYPPYYSLNVDGPNETGFALLVQMEIGAGGPLGELTADGVMENLRDTLAGAVEGTTATLARIEIGQTNL